MPKVAESTGARWIEIAKAVPGSFSPARPPRQAERPRTPRPAQDVPKGSVPRMTIEERRKRLLELMLTVEAELEMMDDPVPF